MADKTVYIKTALTGGAATALDGIDGDNLLDGDVALVLAANIFYVYILDDDSGAAEASPGIIAPDTNPGTKRWILQEVRLATTTNSGVVELATDAEVIAGTDTSRVVTPAGLAAKIGVYDIHEVSEFPDDHTAAGLALLDDADAAAQRTTLGLGTIATQNANNVNISGGAVAGITDLAIADGGTGASTASTARTALGVAIGVDVMAYEAWPIHEVEELCSVD